MAAATLVVLVGVGLVGALISRRSAENESVHQAAELTNVLADSVVQPALTDAMATSTSAAAALDGLVRRRVLSADLLRVKIWSPAGRILYSDEPRLVGRTFDLDAGARRSLSDPQVRADVTDLDEPENRFERGHGRLLEVHRPVWTPSGRPVLFEAYYRYARVSDRAAQLWRGFAGITVSSIVAVVVLLVPLAWTLVARTRRAQRQREDSLRRAVDASVDERRRIAAGLHDGVVQDLVAASLTVSGTAAASREPADAARLHDAAAAVRSSIAGMRSLLVELYPPNLHDAGLERALRDLAVGLPVDVEFDLDPAAVAALDARSVQAAFRLAQEALRNAAAHSGAPAARVSLRRDRSGVVLTVTDDGVGFDPSNRPDGHFGLSLVADAARDADAVLSLSTAPGRGTAWRMEITT
ncbi:sensor histidine kinase [uncultured Jatrophihabitans sp.]|uniref:sensor histidine kinase n=1 Tax=uncultured Jatrophihabitans sp. TaxID=1610747 RepID=UPI0035CA70E8